MSLKAGEVLFRAGDPADRIYVLAIDEKRLLFLVERTPRFALNLMRLLSHRLRRMNALVKA